MRQGIRERVDLVETIDYSQMVKGRAILKQCKCAVRQTFSAAVLKVCTPSRVIFEFLQLLAGEGTLAGRQAWQAPQREVRNSRGA